MGSLAWRKCLNHGEREAVARCPGCASCFCRECVTEHRGRILCAQCLGRLRLGEAPAGSRWLSRSALAAGAATGLLLAWMFFFGLGKLLLQIPASLHEGAWTDAPGRPAE